MRACSTPSSLEPSRRAAAAHAPIAASVAAAVLAASNPAASARSYMPSAMRHWPDDVKQRSSVCRAMPSGSTPASAIAPHSPIARSHSPCRPSAPTADVYEIWSGSIPSRRIRVSNLNQRGGAVRAAFARLEARIVREEVGRRA